MPYYDDAPNKKRRPRPQEDRWEEEGSRYRDGGTRRKPAGERSDRPARTSRGTEYRREDGRGRGEGPRRSGPAADRREQKGPQRTRPAERFGPRSERREEAPRPRPTDRYAPRGPERPERFERREEAPHTRSYRDFEHGTEPVLEDAQATPNENVLSGRNPIREALKSGRDIEKLLVLRGELSGSARQIVQMAREAGVPVQEVEKKRLDEIAPNHQGMIAFASAYAYATVEEMLDLARERGEEPFLVILDGVTDPHNLGAVIRTAECVGVHGVIVRERRGVGLTPAAVKASAGAVEHVKVARVTNLNQLIGQLKRRNIWTYGLSMDGEDYERVDFSGGVALVIGSEGSGISRLTEESCDRKVSLPMKGRLDSLNASVAAGVVMYRVLSGRRA